MTAPARSTNGLAQAYEQIEGELTSMGLGSLKNHEFVIIANSLYSVSICGGSTVSYEDTSMIGVAAPHFCDY